MDIINDYEVVVIGSGHAGVEAALACSRLGHKVVLLTMSLDSVSFLACNPSIGGTAKGHLVTEIDALGGEMGINADKTTIQLRMLNMGKGPAVHSLRAQVDKNKYHIEMKKTLENEKNIYLRQAEVTHINVDKNKVVGVTTAQGETYKSKKIIVCTGVYLKSNIIYGKYSENIGPNGFKSANSLTKNLVDLGLHIRRFKTGTPNRVYIDSINTTELELQKGDDNIQSFSFLTKERKANKAVCYLAFTNTNTHKIINDNLHLAPMLTGEISSTGPRYCPSIETKVTRFKDKDRHQVFIEPEGLDTKEAYIQGISTSFPVNIQRKILKSIKGFEDVKIMRDAYAIEYDCIDSTQLYPTLEYKNIEGIYFAGQINGTSGYEEAAAQGLVAGINAALSIQGKVPFVLKRSDAYIGVLIDDLVTKGTNEPYRMMTSRAEYRLYLRQDNADLRLTEMGYRLGLVKRFRYSLLKDKIKKINENKNKLDIIISPKNIELKKLFKEKSEPQPKTGISIREIIKRSNINIFDVRDHLGYFKNEATEILYQLNVQVKYKGYIDRQIMQIENSKKNEESAISVGLDYNKIKGLRIEAIEKLNNIKPRTIAQASRISGVSPADINILLIYLKTVNFKNK